MNDELSNLIRASAVRYEAPETLKKRVDAALFAADLPAATVAKPVNVTSWTHWLQLGLSFAFGVLLSVGALYQMNTMNAATTVADEIFASHIRSLMPGHSFDVASSDQHTVKPWFNGKLDFSPPVTDLAAQGFPLMGGRLDYINQRTVAALVYGRRAHAINVFVWPSVASTPDDSEAKPQHGFNVTAWRAAGMQFWAVSDIPATELQAFAGLLRQSVQQP